MEVFELDSSKPPALVWWRADATEGWMSLDHLCVGVRHNRLGGWVLPAPVPKASADLLWALDSQEFAADCRGGDLTYEVADEHRAAYVQFLESKGLKAGDVSMLQQAVYPLDASGPTLAALGIEIASAQSGASLLVLGWNDD